MRRPINILAHYLSKRLKCWIYNLLQIIFKHNHDVYCPALNRTPSAKIDQAYVNNISQTYKYDGHANNYLSSPKPIKNDDIAQEYTMDSNHSDCRDDESDECKDSATEEAMKLINLPMDYADNTQLEISRFKGELQRISNIVEDAKNPQMTHYLVNLNSALELINSPQDFYDKFSRIF